MFEGVKFYPEEKSPILDPLEGSESLRYIVEGFPEEISTEELQLRYAFPAKLNIDPPDLKNTVKNILIQILNVSELNIDFEGENIVIDVPIAALSDPDILPGKGTVKIPILIKLVKLANDSEPEAQFKCIQEIQLITDATDAADDADGELEEDEMDQEPDDDMEEDTDEEANDESYEFEEADTEGAESPGLYSGLLAVDYGTSNSSIAVRDPCFASEEVRGQLGTEQWEALCDWMNIWLSNHLSQVEPTTADQFVQSLTAVIPNAEIPECGSPKSDITQSLNRMSDEVRIQLLRELISRLSNYSRQGSDAEMMKTLAIEVMEGFEAVIDSNSLESQRYFVLELDKNVGPGPISSVLQVLASPNTEDTDTLVQETKVDMGARVGLLLRSAALGEIDIRQFVLSSKRYFGRDETIPVVPADSGGDVIEIPADILAKLTYKELFSRAVADIHRRAEQGKFQDAEWMRNVVATFPTSYPAALRRAIRELLEGLDIKEIDTRFDEATAAAIYYIWREIGADPVCGMHGLMARSRKDKYGRAYQNILLYDLGGGTTDIALIQLLYEEIAVFDVDEDRGHGGSYFRITPRLLGTTGHRHLGGDLVTLWVFRYIKSVLADLLLNIITEQNLEPPMDSPLHQLLLDIPESLMEEGSNGDDVLPRYRSGALLDWTLHPAQSLRDYTHLNEKVIDAVIPTRFINDQSKIPNFFTLWEITDELKKTLGTPIIENFGTCLGTGLADNWPEEVELDSGQLYNFIQMAQPWLVDNGHVQQDNLHIVVTQEQMNQVISDTISQSISLASSLAQARLTSEERSDRVDKLILCGLSCNMKVIQDVSQTVFRESDVFDYDPANVRFDRDSAKTSVSLGACIGRYMESVRVDPYNEKTRQLLRDGYDQIELVIENLFSYLPCRLAYDSLVAMVPIFDQGQELNVRSYWDREFVARTSLKSLRPVQEKFWVYRIDFIGAEPLYLGLINAEEVARENGFENFRKFREEYLVGFEADAELLVRGFFLPKGQTKIEAKDYEEPAIGEAHPEIISPVDGYVPPAKDKDKEEEPEPDMVEEDMMNEESPEMEEEDIPQDNVDEDEEFVEEGEGEEGEFTEGEGEEGDEGEEEEFTEDEGEEEEEEPAHEEDMSDDDEPKSVKQHKMPIQKRRKGGNKNSYSHVLNCSIAVKETLEDITVIPAGEPLRYTLEYPDGRQKACCISEAIHIREKLEVVLIRDTEDEVEDEMVEKEPDFVFNFDEEEVDELTLACDEDGNVIALTKCLFEIEMSAEIEYETQKVDINFDPFCGQH